MPRIFDFGKLYGTFPAYHTPHGDVGMWRKGQKVRFYTADGTQMGPEQANVAPAVAFALHNGWRSIDLTQEDA